MKPTVKFTGIIVFLLCGALSATPIAETKLKVESGKMLFHLVKTMAGSDSQMTGLADQVSGSINLKEKTFDITMEINLKTFDLSGMYKFANERMHETYLESSKFPVANYKGTIVSYDPATGNAKVTGKMTIHGVTKDKVEIEGHVAPSQSGSGYLLTGGFKVNLKDFKITVPDIKLAKVSEMVDLKIKFELRSAD
ncbi:MAG: YceI family protein [Leptospira sp.]|nr:YceI family protein [Leptospira sp.]